MTPSERVRRQRQSERDRALDDDRVMTFSEWCRLNGFSEATGRRLRRAGKAAAFVQLSDRRVGCTVRSNREWQESRKIAAPTDAARDAQPPHKKADGGLETGRRAGAWDSPGWKKAATEYHRDRAGRPLIVELEPDGLKRLRDLLKDGTSFLRAYYEINTRRDSGAPQSAVEAFMYPPREKGTKTLDEPATKRRLSELSDQQVIEVGNRLQKLRPEIARAWSATEVETLFQASLKR